MEDFLKKVQIFPFFQTESQNFDITIQWYHSTQFSVLGLYSRKAFERIGFHVNAEYLYSDYKDEESGEQIFASAVDPHRCVTLMTKQLSDKEHI